MNFTIAKRAYALLGLLLAILAGNALIAVIMIGQAKQDLEAMGENTVGAVALADAQSDLWQLRYATPQFMVGNPAARAKILEQEPKLQKSIEDAFAAYGALRLSDEERQALEEMKGIFKEYMQVRPRWFQLYGEDKIAEANEWRAQKNTPMGAAMVKGFDKVIALQKQMSDSKERGAVAAFQTMRTAVLAVIALAMVVTAVVMLWLVRSIVRPLQGAVDAAGRIAAGDLSVDFEVAGRDEIAELQRALATMAASLRQLVGEVLRSTDSVSTASREIAQSHADLSSRTEQQASALEETSASMQQMTATVGQNAQNARQVHELAAQASSVAAKGGEVVKEAVGTMNGITESSKKIADIIGVIDGIAFQTNILALNAAVEAARAGEQGRGFAVVASEVRSLAQRSAAAAKEIKDLITDSVAKVDAGSRQVDDTGRTMEEIVGSVKKVTGLIAEIAAASQEQAQGIEQVSSTMTQLEKVTQQNAAMVEQASAAAGSLEDQARMLARAVAAFKLGAQRPAPAPAAKPVEAKKPAEVKKPVEIKKPVAAQKKLVEPKKPVAPVHKPYVNLSALKPAPGKKGNGHLEEGWQEF
jgi:methyl-accepting chemotaxis protein